METVLGWSDDFWDDQSIGWPASIWSTSMGIVSLSMGSLERMVRLSWPLWPGRTMPAGPLGATASTAADGTK